MPVDVNRKEIRHLHLGVYPPDGRVRVSAPLWLGEEAIRLAVVSRIGWIRRQQRGFERQERQSAREMLTGESHYVAGRRYRLRIVEYDAPPRIRLVSSRTLELTVRTEASAEKRAMLLERWYREQLRSALPALIERWAPRVGVDVAEWRIRRMKTRWGTCNAETRRICVNLELAKKPPACLEYIVVHELVHLLERRHTDRFGQLMDALLPQWRLSRAELNRAPLAHVEWSY